MTGQKDGYYPAGEEGEEEKVTIFSGGTKIRPGFICYSFLRSVPVIMNRVFIGSNDLLFWAAVTPKL